MGNLVEMIDCESVEKISHEYIQSKLDEYKEVMMIITQKVMSIEDGLKLAAFTKASEETYHLKYTIIILSDEIIEEKILDVFPNFSAYPTTIVAKDGKFFRVIEENFFE